MLKQIYAQFCHFDEGEITREMPHSIRQSL